MHGKKILKEEIIRAVQNAYKEGVDLRTSAVQRGPLRRYYRSHKLHFASWRDVICEAGYTYEDIVERVKASECDAAREKYLEELLCAYKQGIDLSSTALVSKGKPYSSLYYRARRFFTGRFFWETALTEAGIPFEQVVRQFRWDKEKVKCRLISRHEHGLGLNHAAVKEEECDLAKAIQNHFISFDAALEYAGFRPDAIRKNGISLSVEEIVDAVRVLGRQGVNLNETYILKQGKNKQHKRLVWQSRRRFDNGWEEVVTCAGYDYDDYRQVERGWSREKVLERIGVLYLREPLNGGYISVHHSGLYHAAVRYIGSWEKAISAYGLDYADILFRAPSLTQQGIIAAIRRLYDRDGDLSADGMTRHHDLRIRSVYYQAQRRFPGGWAEAISQAGYDYDDIRKKRSPYTFDELSRIVRDLAAQGVNLMASRIHGDSRYKKYYSAVRRHGFGWYTFLAAIGIDESAIDFSPIPHPQRLSQKEIIASIQQFHEKGISLNSSFIAGHDDVGVRRVLYQAQRRFPGGWAEAVGCAGYHYRTFCRRHPEYTLSELKAHVKQIYENGESVRAVDVQCHVHYRRYYQAVFKRGYRWYDFLERELGIDISAIPRIKKQPRRTGGFTQEDIIDEILYLHHHGYALDKTSMVSNNDLLVRRVYYQAQYRFSGGWAQAVSEAGLDYEHIKRERRLGSFGELVSCIQQLDREGVDLSPYVIRNHPQYGSYYRKVTRRGYSWSRFLDEIGIDRSRFMQARANRASLSQEAVIERIRTLYNAGVSLRITDMRGSDDRSVRQVFHQAVYRFDGGWAEAVTCAGYSYHDICMRHRLYVDRKLAGFITQLHQSGVSLFPEDLRKKPHYFRYYTSVMSRHDSWFGYLCGIGIKDRVYDLAPLLGSPKGVIEYIHRYFDTGIVDTRLASRGLLVAASRQFGGIRNAASAAGYVYAERGKITLAAINSDAVHRDLLFRCNREYLIALARNEYFFKITRKRQSLDLDDMVHEAFSLFMELLLRKPGDRGVREFCVALIRKHLIKINGLLQEEVGFGEEVFLDLFKGDDVDDGTEALDFDEIE